MFSWVSSVTGLTVFRTWNKSFLLHWNSVVTTADVQSDSVFISVLLLCYLATLRLDQSNRKCVKKHTKNEQEMCGKKTQKTNKKCVGKKHTKKRRNVWKKTQKTNRKCVQNRRTANVCKTDIWYFNYRCVIFVWQALSLFGGYSWVLLHQSARSDLQGFNMWCFNSVSENWTRTISNRKVQNTRTLLFIKNAWNKNLPFRSLEFHKVRAQLDSSI